MESGSESSSAERKRIKFQDKTTVTIILVSKLSEARKLILTTQEAVLLDRFQAKGKSVVIFPSTPPLQVFNATKEALLKMTELSEIDGELKNRLLKLSPDVAQNFACFEVDNRFASIMRQIESVC